MPGHSAEDLGQAYMTQPAAGDYGQEAQQPDAVHEEPVKVSMTVPEGALPGTKLQYAAPDGQELRLTVPDGVPPGSLMTLTQDPVTKQWKCMAEPVESPVPSEMQPHQQQHQSYAAQPAPYSAPAPSERVVGATYVNQTTPVVTYMGGGQVTTTPTPLVTHMVPRVLNHNPLPVNLSYVPPPSAQQAVAMMPSQVIVGQPGVLPVNPSQFNPPRQVPDYPVGEYMEQRPSYTPPPVVMEQRPSYTPPPVLTMGQHVQMGVPGGQQMEPALMASTAKVSPQHIAQQLQQQQQQQVVGQTLSYVPPPVQVMQNSPSYIPPVLGQPQVDAAATSVQMPAVVPTQQGPSITTLPSQEHMLVQQQAQ